MLVAAVAVPDGVEIQGASDDGAPSGPSRTVTIAEISEIERHDAPRWILGDTLIDYPPMAASGVRLGRSHDLALVRRLLDSRTGQFSDLTPAAAPSTEPGLFPWAGSDGPRRAAAELLADYRAQHDEINESAAGDSARRHGIAVPAGALRLAAAAESGSALVAVEMTRVGLPFDRAIHDGILTSTLGPRPAEGHRPARLAELARQVADAFGFPVNPGSPAELLAALHRSGIDVESTRAHVLRGVDHPVIAPLLSYKELARLWTANGWHWADEWVSANGRLTTQFLPGAVVSGRWATRGGGGLQLPATIRAAAVARPGWALVVADAAQLEPRIWAARAADPALTRLTDSDDLYTALAADGFGGDRRHAKLAMLGAMYGQTSGEAARLMATMRVRYPVAVDYVERAARVGETGGVVASVLGRACPPPSDGWRRAIGSGMEGARRIARDRGRFTRNFVIQASAADWAAAWITGLRLALLNEVPEAEMVLFLHDEIVLHVPEAAADRVCELTIATAHTARDLVFPGSAVPTPVRPVAVRSYADAK